MQRLKKIKISITEKLGEKNPSVVMPIILSSCTSMEIRISGDKENPAITKIMKDLTVTRY